ncbi:MAG: hypothetical protein ACRC62_38815 [Microcoleus sp.]
MSTVLFLDNDIILKLVACNLFWESVVSLGATQLDLRVLPDAKFVFKNSRKIVRKYPEAIRSSAISIVGCCPKIQLVSIDPLQQLEIEGIDPGERLLIAAALDEESFYLATGDKRCLKALAAAPQLFEIKQRLEKRVICLEQLIKKLIEIQGFDEVLSRVLPVRDCDKALASIFGSGSRATRDNVLLALSGYIDELREETSGLLADL